MIDVVWKTYNPQTIARGYWDQAMLEDAFSGALWTPPHGYSFVHHERFEDVVGNGAVVVLPARHNVDHIEALNADLAGLDWVLLLLTGDEESLFPYDLVRHQNMRIWVMQPDVTKPYRLSSACEVFGSGYTPGFPERVGRMNGPARNRRLDWFFAGQVNHAKRVECAEEIRQLPNGQAFFTNGFGQGQSWGEYALHMAEAKVVPCPSGPASQDSFRFYETLEAGAVPVVEEHPYWDVLFVDAPVPRVSHWSEFKDELHEILATWPVQANITFAWWQAAKRQFALSLRNDIAELRDGGLGEPWVPEQTSLLDSITVLIPTSPIPSHPDTAIIEETVASVRAQLPDSEIIIMLDGVRPEQEQRRADYEEYQRRLLWLCNTKWRNVLPMRIDAHLHQASMTLLALDLVETPLVLFVEHDAPLVGEFDWDALKAAFHSDDVKVIRFHHESRILEPHEHLMLDKEPQHRNGAPLLRTIQWSQRPHLALTSYYRQMIEKNFDHQSRTMIEDVMHSVVQVDHDVDGEAGWKKHGLWIYAPDGNMQRSTHLDGRGDDPKYEMVIL